MSTMLTHQDEKLFKQGSIIAGRYEVLNILGEGGMGVVVEIVDHALDGEIAALKILDKHLSGDETQFGRFKNEVLLARKLSHPNIVRIYDFGTTKEGYYYLSMEYVNGGSLSSCIYGEKDSAIGFESAVDILIQICEGLSIAHRKDIIHRDLKPDNILLTHDYEVKIADLGLARALDMNKNYTMTGETVGTPFYMSPEQLAGEKPDRRVDIYSVGILAYEMIAREKPFFSENYIEIAHMHMSSDIPKLADKGIDVPEWYQEFIEICSAKRRQDRFFFIEEAKEFLISNSKSFHKRSDIEVPSILNISKISKANKFNKPLVLFLMLALILSAIIFGLVAIF